MQEDCHSAWNSALPLVCAPVRPSAPQCAPGSAASQQALAQGADRGVVLVGTARLARGARRVPVDRVGAQAERAGLPGRQYVSTYRRYLTTEVGSLPLAQLEQRDIEKWRDGIATMPAWEATTRFGPIGEVETGSTQFEAMRRRRFTANNHLMAHKCALDHAHLHGLVDSSIGWRGVG